MTQRCPSHPKAELKDAKPWVPLFGAGAIPVKQCSQCGFSCRADESEGKEGNRMQSKGAEA